MQRLDQKVTLVSSGILPRSEATLVAIGTAMKVPDVAEEDRLAQIMRREFEGIERLLRDLDANLETS